MERSNLKYFAAVTAVLLTAGFLTGTPTLESTVASISAGNFSLPQTQALQDQTNPEITETTAVNLQEGLKAYYRFDNPEVSRRNSIEFDGVDDYIEISDSDSLDNAFGETFNFTLTAWVKIEEWEDWRAIQNKASCGSWSCTTAGLWAYEGGFVAVMGSDEGGNPDGSYVRAEYKPSLNRWHHAAAVGNGTHVKLYVNGELRDTNTITDYIKENLTSNSEPLVLGRRCGGCVESTNGSVARVKAYNRTLAAEEIKDLYRSRPISDEGLVLSMDMDSEPSECDLTVSQRCIGDISSYSNDGKPVNFDYNEFGDPAGWEDETPINRPSVKDYSKNDYLGKFFYGNNGRITSFDGLRWIEGVSGKALNFSASGNGYLTGIDNSVLAEAHNPDRKVTINFWFKVYDLKNSNNYNDFIQFGDTENGTASQGNGFRFERFGDSNDTLSFYTTYDRGNNQYRMGNVGPYQQGKWHMATLVMDGDKVKTYFDADVYSDSNLPGDTWNISGDSSIEMFPEGDWADITIDRFTIHDKALSSSQVGSLYAQEKVKEEIVGRWNFNSGNRRKLYETSGFDRKGILGSDSISVSDSRELILGKYGIQESFTLSAWMKGGESNWLYKKPVSLAESSYSRKGVFEYVNISLTSGLLSGTPEDEIVVYDSSGSEISSNVVEYNNGSHEWAIVAFNASISKHKPKKYNIYYGNPAPPEKENIYSEYSVDFYAAGNDWDSSNPTYYWARNGTYVSGPDWNAPSATNAWQNWTGINLFDMIQAKSLDNIVNEGKSREDVSGDDSVVVRNNGCQMEPDPNFIGSNPSECSNGSLKHFGLYIVHSLTYNSGCYSVNPFTLVPSDYEYQKNLDDIPHSFAYYVYPEASSYGTWTEHCDPNIAAFDDDTYTILPLRNLVETRIGSETTVGLSKSGMFGLSNSNSLKGSHGGQTLVTSSTSGWKNIVLASKDSGEVKLYVNGELRETSMEKSSVIKDRYLKFGDITGYNGELDELRIYNRSLSDKEIKRLAFR
jgi:hypothetical protein